MSTYAEALTPIQVREKLREEMDRQEQFGVQYGKVILKKPCTIHRVLRAASL
jgi:hypothetical protein